ncbi:hypothetical protein ACFL2E_04410 [Thermodesulfobacteriota bacterium]
MGVEEEIMVLKNDEKNVADILAKYAFIEQCKETGLITLTEYTDICNSWGDWALELIQQYLRRIDEYHQDTRKFIDELKVSGDWA